ncbi:MAG: S1 family peptidase [Burkholderiaceae bacterium]|nr:S1 family peptidase [Burkholderiaceae bacterium]
MPTKRTRNEFEDPVEGKPPEEGSTQSEEFEPPADAATLAVEAGDAEMEAALAQVDPQILSAKAELEKLLAEHARAEVGIQSAEVMEANIVGVGIGLGDPAAGALPGEPTLEVYTIEPATEAETKARLASAAGVSALAEADFPMNVVCTGIIDAQPHRMRLRPAPGGISVGHFRITAGTLGCLARGRTAPRINRLMILSNNHVLANSNAAAIGDCVAQPGPIDGGRCPADQVAVLERFVPINFAGGANVVDCATAWAWPDRVRRELMYISGGVTRFFRVGATPVAAARGMLVGKSGRTTQLTRGTITAVGVAINVNYGGRIARFVDQIAIRAASGDFSRGGDSGSLIWTWDTRRAPVGLLFAGGGGTTFANRITRVLAALDIQLFT